MNLCPFGSVLKLRCFVRTREAGESIEPSASALGGLAIVAS